MHPGSTPSKQAFKFQYTIKDSMHRSTTGEIGIIDHYYSDAYNRAFKWFLQHPDLESDDIRQVEFRNVEI